jgi:hypothetical protein
MLSYVWTLQPTAFAAAAAAAVTVSQDGTAHVIRASDFPCGGALGSAGTVIGACAASNVLTADSGAATAVAALPLVAAVVPEETDDDGFVADVDELLEVEPHPTKTTVQASDAIMNLALTTSLLWLFLIR